MCKLLKLHIQTFFIITITLLQQQQQEKEFGVLKCRMSKKEQQLK